MIKVDGVPLVDSTTDNSCHLKFEDHSSDAALGTDSLGGSHNWTVNNISTSTADDGLNLDVLVDSPSSYGEDTGAGGEVRGNYCVMSL